MRYKNDYKPQYILDPDTYQWQPLNDEMKARLDRKGFISLSRDRLGESKIGEAGPANTSKPAPVVFTSPKAAERSGQSLIQFRMPGILTQDELDADVDLSKIVIQLGQANKPQFAPAAVCHRRGVQLSDLLIVAATCRFRRRVVVREADARGADRLYWWGGRSEDRCGLHALTHISCPPQCLEGLGVNFGKSL